MRAALALPRPDTQIRAARGLLALSQVEPAEMASLSVANVKRLETASGVRGAAETIWKIQKALEAAGVEFIPEEGGRAPHVSMRLWVLEPGSEPKAATRRDYETVGYVISGTARLDLEGQTLKLKAGDAWLVPAGAMHHSILEPFTAVEATAPPAEVHGRDEPV